METLPKEAVKEVIREWITDKEAYGWPENKPSMILERAIKEAFQEFLTFNKKEIIEAIARSKMIDEVHLHEHAMEDAPQQGCDCLMCNAARAAKGV